MFKDFEVGRTMRRSITLTNVSYTFNTFRVVDLPDDIKDFFVVNFFNFENGKCKRESLKIGLLKPYLLLQQIQINECGFRT